MIQSECVYAGLSALYNVVLNPSLACRFRIIITKNLLTNFLSSRDAGIRFLAKFSVSCLHPILAATERDLLTLDAGEMTMITRCLNGVDNFFGGRHALLVTVGNLTHCHGNQELFISVGVVHTLVGLALNEEGSLKLHSLSAILSMLPEKAIPDGDWKDDRTDKKNLLSLEPVDSCVTRLITSMPTFVTMISNCPSKDKCFHVSSGINILTRPAHLPGLLTVLTCKHKTSLQYILVYLYKLIQVNDWLSFQK